MFYTKQLGSGFITFIDRYRLRSLIALITGSAGVNFTYLVCLATLGVILNNIEFGLFRIAYAYIMMAVSLCHLGLNSSLTRLLPQLTIEQRKASMLLGLMVSIATSLVGGAIVFALVPVPFEFTLIEHVLYFIIYPLSIGGALLCNFILVFFQAEGELGTYARFQTQWRFLLLSGAILGGLIGGGLWALVFMAFSYFFIFWSLWGKIFSIRDIFSSKAVMFDWSATYSLIRGAVWPLAALAVSTIYSNVEFLCVTQDDIQRGIAGSYSLASLIFLGGSAMFFPFQTYAVSKIVRHEISFAGIWRLQLLCFALVLLMAAFSVVGAGFLIHTNPLKFDENFFNFTVLVSFKLVLWSLYSVTGAVLYYIGKEFESFLLTLVALAGLIIFPILLNRSVNIEVMLKMQLVTGSIVFLGCSLIFCFGFSKYKTQQLPSHC